MLFRDVLRWLFFWMAYYRNPPWDTGISPPELMEFIQNHPPGRAIDLGCGTGTNVITLAQHGWQVAGVDFIPKAIRAARRKIKQAGVTAEVKVGDVTRLDFPEGSFDLALDIGCYHNLPPQSKQAYERLLRKILAKGGSFLLYGFLKTPAGTLGIGEEDVERLQTFLTLVQRRDGTDRERPSSWFHFVKP